MRTQTTELLCLKCPADPAGYLGSDLFREKFDHTSWLTKIFGRLARAKKNESVNHYSKKYSGRFPLWVVAESMDFSDFPRLFSGFPVPDQKQFAGNLNWRINFPTLPTEKQNKIKR